MSCFIAEPNIPFLGNNIDTVSMSAGYYGALYRPSVNALSMRKWKQNACLKLRAVAGTDRGLRAGYVRYGV